LLHEPPVAAAASTVGRGSVGNDCCSARHDGQEVHSDVSSNSASIAFGPLAAYPVLHTQVLTFSTGTEVLAYWYKVQILTADEVLQWQQNLGINFSLCFSHIASKFEVYYISKPEQGIVGECW
jgi:hypothetical protein